MNRASMPMVLDFIRTASIPEVLELFAAMTTWSRELAGEPPAQPASAAPAGGQTSEKVRDKFRLNF